MNFTHAQDFTINEVIQCSLEIKNPLKYHQDYVLKGDKSTLAGALIIKFLTPSESNDRLKPVIGKPAKAIFNLMYQEDSKHLSGSTSVQNTGTLLA